MEPILSARNLSKCFGRVRALDKVNIDLHAGEVVGVVGDNGAGKSTLIKLLAGVFPPDEGKIYLWGKEMVLNSPGEVRNLGIETIYQDLALVNNLDIGANIFLGREPVRGRLGGAMAIIDRDYIDRESARVLERLGIHFTSPRQKVYTLSGGQRQAVAIARAIYWDARIILMDEPTTSLGVSEKLKVLSIIRSLRDEGVPMIIASHELPDVLAVANRIIVLREGKKVGGYAAEETDREEIINLMMGWS
jgi:ABC-type sugar transport system ATPase subunit